MPLAAARALSDLPEMDAVQIAQKAMDVASDLCVYTNKELITEPLATEDETADVVPRLEAHMRGANAYNTPMRKPTADDACGANAYAAWERKIYVVVCGGLPGVARKKMCHV